MQHNKPPKIPASVPVSGSSISTTSGTSPTPISEPLPATSSSHTPMEQTLSQKATVLKGLIIQLRDKCDGSLQSVLDRYVQTVSPSFAVHGDSPLPRTVKYKQDGSIPRFSVSSFGDLICCYVGHAVLQYYRAVLGNPSSLDASIVNLQFLAFDPKDFTPFGSDSTGYHLVTREYAKKKAREADEAFERKQMGRGDVLPEEKTTA